MMLGFQRNEGVKTALGIGEFDPLFKKLREGLDRYFTGKGLWTNQAMGLPRYKIHWKHQIDRGGGNCHVIAGLIDSDTIEHPLNRDVVIMARQHLKTVFAFNQCKMIAVERYPANKKKIYQKYGFEKEIAGSKGVIIIKYSKMS